MVTRSQLIALGVSPEAIRHRAAGGRLRRLYRGVYSVGHHDPTQLGRWMAAVLACGPNAVLSHRSAGALWGMVATHAGAIEVTAPGAPRGIRLHRGAGKPRTTHRGIPVTSPVATLVDLATQLSRESLVAAVGEADRLDLVDPEAVRQALKGFARRPGVVALRTALDRHTFVLTHTELERRFLEIVRQAGLPLPDGQRRVGRYRVDFLWPWLVVETDGLRYHRTAARQSSDLRRDHAHAVAGRQRLRFSHAQVGYEPGYVAEILREVPAGRR